MEQFDVVWLGAFKAPRQLFHQPPSRPPQANGLIPADGFYEWKKQVGSKSKPFYVRRSDGQQMIFAGIWQFSGDSEHRIPTCTIITVPASEQISGIHNRMPLIIDPSDWAGWLGEGQGFKAAKLMKTPSDIELEVVNVTNEIKSTNAPV